MRYNAFVSFTVLSNNLEDGKAYAIGLDVVTNDGHSTVTDFSEEIKTLPAGVEPGRLITHLFSFIKAIIYPM